MGRVLFFWFWAVAFGWLVLVLGMLSLVLVVVCGYLVGWIVWLFWFLDFGCGMVLMCFLVFLWVSRFASQDWPVNSMELCIVWFCFHERDVFIGGSCVVLDSLFNVAVCMLKFWRVIFSYIMSSGSASDLKRETKMATATKENIKLMKASNKKLDSRIEAVHIDGNRSEKEKPQNLHWNPSPNLHQEKPKKPQGVWNSTEERGGCGSRRLSGNDWGGTFLETNWWREESRR